MENWSQEFVNGFELKRMNLAGHMAAALRFMIEEGAGDDLLFYRSLLQKQIEIIDGVIGSRPVMQTKSAGLCLEDCIGNR